jgi:hypothetical protein
MLAAMAQGDPDTFAAVVQPATKTMPFPRPCQEQLQRARRASTQRPHDKQPSPWRRLGSQARHTQGSGVQVMELRRATRCSRVACGRRLPDGRGSADDTGIRISFTCPARPESRWRPLATRAGPRETGPTPAGAPTEDEHRTDGHGQLPRHDVARVVDDGIVKEKRQQVERRGEEQAPRFEAQTSPIYDCECDRRCQNSCNPWKSRARLQR